MRFKYSCCHFGHPIITVKNNISNVWKAISNIWISVGNNISWTVRDGNNIRFWKDSWILGFGNLAELFEDNTWIMYLKMYAKQ